MVVSSERRGSGCGSGCELRRADELPLSIMVSCVGECEKAEAGSLGSEECWAGGDDMKSGRRQRSAWDVRETRRLGCSRRNGSGSPARRSPRAWAAMRTSGSSIDSTLPARRGVCWCGARLDESSVLATLTSSAVIDVAGSVELCISVSGLPWLLKGSVDGTEGKLMAAAEVTAWAPAAAPSPGGAVVAAAAPAVVGA